MSQSPTPRRLPLALRRVEAARCDSCRGRGHTQGLFHALPCAACEAAGYVQASTGQVLDSMAMAIIAQAAATDRRAVERERRTRPDTGTPDNWIWQGRFRGD